jgi:hypothetical protein
VARYIFETMASADALTFSATDTLTFHTAAVVDLGIVDTPYTTNPYPTGETLTLSVGGRSLVFDAAALRTASHNGGLHFDNGDALALGTAGDDTGGNSLVASGLAGHHALVLGYAGADSITGSAANDTLDGGAGYDTIVGGSAEGEADYLFGGEDRDSIIGGAGNDHIYGNSLTTIAGSWDGEDTILAGAGMDYVNGNPEMTRSTAVKARIVCTAARATTRSTAASATIISRATKVATCSLAAAAMTPSTAARAMTSSSQSSVGEASYMAMQAMTPCQAISPPGWKAGPVRIASAWPSPRCTISPALPTLPTTG